MSSEKNIGAPVRVERHDPDLVEAVAKAKVYDPGEIRYVTRLEGLIINERACHRALTAAADLMETARLAYHRALEDYSAAVDERKQEEAK